MSTVAKSRLLHLRPASQFLSDGFALIAACVLLVFVMSACGDDDDQEPAEPEDRLVILPEIKREGERFFLSSFKLPEKLTFAGQSVPLDNWQVRERIEYEFYQFLEDQGESIILAKRTGRCFAPAEGC